MNLTPQTQEKFSMDAQRPVYHFMAPQNWINDPNGLIQWKGVYHLFYQHNPYAADWGPMYWGHATSRDLIHWEHKPVAMAPTPGGPDEDGCWSGCAVNFNGTPYILYSGNRKDENGRFQQRCCIARSDDDLETLVKYEHNPVISDLPQGYEILDFRDHCVWFDGSCWNQLIGAGIKDQGGAVFLYQSTDLFHWSFTGPILVGSSKPEDALWSGTVWECPDLIPLGDRHLLVVSVIAPGQTGYTGCFLGKFQDGKFTPESFRKLDLGDRGFYAPQSFANEAGERIQIGWIPDARANEANQEAGWAGLLTLPRLLTLRPDGRVGVMPHPAVQGLRGKEIRMGAPSLTSETQVLPIQGRALELHAVFSASSDARSYGLKVFSAPDGSEETILAFDPRQKTLRVLRELSSLDPRSETGPAGGVIDLSDGEDLDLRIFLDQSALEIYINGRETLTCRAYPTQPASVGVSLFAEDGSVHLKELTAWEIKSI